MRLESFGAMSSSLGSLDSDLRFFSFGVSGLDGWMELRRGREEAAVKGTRLVSDGAIVSSNALALDGIFVDTPTSIDPTNFFDESTASDSRAALGAALVAAPRFGLVLRVAGGSAASFDDHRVLLFSGCVGVNVNSNLSSSSSAVRFRFTTDFVRPIFLSFSLSFSSVCIFPALDPLLSPINTFI